MDKLHIALIIVILVLAPFSVYLYVEGNSQISQLYFFSQNGAEMVRTLLNSGPEKCIASQDSEDVKGLVVYITNFSMLHEDGSLTPAGETTTAIDHCEGGNLVKYSCFNGGPSAKIIDCICKDGACVR